MILRKLRIYYIGLYLIYCLLTSCSKNNEKYNPQILSQSDYQVGVTDLVEVFANEQCNSFYGEYRFFSNPQVKMFTHDTSKMFFKQDKFEVFYTTKAFDSIYLWSVENRLIGITHNNRVPLSYVAYYINWRNRGSYETKSTLNHNIDTSTYYIKSNLDEVKIRSIFPLFKGTYIRQNVDSIIFDTSFPIHDHNFYYNIVYR
ncbi:MAG: hypothetical protein K1X91_11460 [Bacteriodetes bacterium]|nr:hypothetical protein [Bacteroidota bacterium]